MHLPVRTFADVCEELARRCTVLPLAEMATALSAGRRLPENAAAITFDDGYASVHDLALPVLKKLGLPATVFVTTGFVDGDCPLWFQQVELLSKRAEPRRELEALKLLPNQELRNHVATLESAAGGSPELPEHMKPLSWDQVRRLCASGLVEVGGHTHTHPILARCRLEEQRWEIAKCRDRISSETGRCPVLFAYPNGGSGDYMPATVDSLAEAGFQFACTTSNGRASPASDPFELPRYGAPESRWEAAATVSGAFEIVKEWRQRGRNQPGGQP